MDANLMPTAGGPSALKSGRSVASPGRHAAGCGRCATSSSGLGAWTVGRRDLMQARKSQEVRSRSQEVWSLGFFWEE